jgi:transglutaminase-like putative cysteine protease
MQVFDIRFVSEFRYPQPVWDSHNLLRACPCSDERQTLLSYRVELSPSASVVTYQDYFGTRVDLFGVAQPHRALEVAAEMRVAVAMSDAASAEPPAACGPAADERFRADHWEYLVPSPHVAFGEAIANEARDAIAGAGDDPAAHGAALCEHVRRTFQYAPGWTHIGIDVAELQRSRRGVCQDFAHYLIALCRSVGVPARYVSGYLFAADSQDSATPAADEVLVQTHAWAEIAIPGAGWWSLDPTNRMVVGGRHVKIGHGRDYDDVLPLRGLYHGPFQHELEVSVRMRRLATPQRFG